MKLGIGTVQFGMDYGVSNKNGQVSLEEIKKILQYAQSNNIDTIDTAQAYGKSEEILGKFDLSKFRIVTKIFEPSLFEQSLKNLNVSNVYGLLWHDEDSFNESDWEMLQKYKAQNLVEKIGVSVYTPEKLDFIVDNFDIDLVQIPVNILDQRFLKLLPKLKEKNIEVHSRSTFLQGLLLMNTKDVNPYFNEIKPLLDELPENKLQAAIQFVKNNNFIDRIIVGVTSESEIQEIYTNYVKKEATNIDYAKFSIKDEKFINPSNWRLE